MPVELPADWLRSAAAHFPERLALQTGGRRWNFAQLDQAASQMARRLAAAGVQPGMHIAALLPNCPEYVFLVHALLRLQAVLVPLNIRLSAAELAWQIEQAGCQALACVPETGAQAGAAAPGLPLLDLRAADGRQGRIPPAAGRQPGRVGAPIQAIIFTSGTTGQPKGAMLSLRNHFYSATASAERLGCRAGDAWLATLPLFHVGGQAILFRSLLYGAAVILQPGFDPLAVLEAIETGPAQIVSLVPTMLQRLLELPGGERALAGLRLILLGGAAAPQPLLKRCVQAGLPVSLTYGMTEAASQIATAAPGLLRRKPGSAGPPLRFNQLRILDPDGRPLPPNQTGQIAVRGPTLMAGYYNQPAASQAALRGGELLTGDLGYFDPDGDLWVVQRRADLIVSGGENVYPAEVEAVLLSHPGVENACVVGLDDELWGQRVAAAVSPRPGQALQPAELQAYCRQRLAGYKTPRQFLVLERLPQTETGKILRRQIVQLFEQPEPVS